MNFRAFFLVLAVAVGLLWMRSTNPPGANSDDPRDSTQFAYYIIRADTLGVGRVVRK